MLIGLLLGAGVALTYAASLGGILPVLKVVVENQSLRDWLIQKADAHAAWYSPTLRALALLFPADLTPAGRLNSLLGVMGVLLFINILGNACRCVSQYLVLFASHRAMMDLRRRLYRKSLHVPVSQVTGNVAERVSQFMSDTREIFLGVTTLFGKVAREPLKAVFVLGVALAMDWRLTLAVVTIAPAAVGILWYFGRRVRKATVRLLSGYGLMVQGLEETLHGIDTVKLYAREGHERRRMWRLERQLMKQQLRLSWIEAFSAPLIEVVGVLVASGAIVWLASRTFSGELSPSHFMTMVILLAALLDPVRKVANVYNMVQRSGAACGRVLAFLEQAEERSPFSATAAPSAGPPEVVFDRVVFRYSPQQSPPALDQVSLRVAPGECVALVGPNGSGKSTLLKLLPRLLDAESGQVLLDGQELRSLPLRTLRHRIAVVAQRPAIFARSVRENIAYGLPDASEQQVSAAAEAAFALEFIQALPEGFDTVIGEFGTSLSGGQRQRLAIARAFLKPADVLVFDEATSEVDADSEHKIHDALHRLRRDKTTFLIAHRHTVMDMADRIVVLDGGRVVDSGTREQLLERCPLFVALYRAPGA